MRAETDRAKLERFMSTLGNRVRGPGTIYLAGGATALLYGWRGVTIDVDIKADPEPPGFFEAIASLKDELDVNVELANPDQFIPAVPGWRDRSIFVGSFGRVRFFHYDPYGQTLAKLQRGHDRDWRDARSFVESGLVQVDELRNSFREIEPQLIRYPAIDAKAFRAAVEDFCSRLRPAADDR